MFSKKKNFISSLLGSLLLLTSLQSQAYDVDTHFYGTYSLARFAGIRHEVAAKIATAAQWMDESYISDPLSMIILADVGIKKRRLLHFPGSRVANKLTVSTLPTILDPSSGVKLKTFTETEADHEFATEMFTEGLMEGNLMKAATGLHTLEDSFAHAGTIAELGHAHFWHHPDRPYVDEASVEKYFLMSRSVLKAMVAIRSLLPMSGIDTSIKFSPENPNYKLNGDQLADIYTQLPDVRKAISRKILNEPEFVDFALNNVFARALKANYLNNGYQSYLKNYKPGDDAYQAGESVFKSLPPQMINISEIYKDNGRHPNPDADYILSMAGNLTTKVIRDLFTGIVPQPLNVYHRFEKEEDGPIWIKELDLRVGNMRALIKRLYNTDVYFVANNTNNEAGYIQELTLQPQAKPVLPQPNGVSDYITYTLKEKNQFNQSIFRFLFPKLSEKIKGNTDAVAELAQLVLIAKESANGEKTIIERSTGILNSGLNLIKNLPGLSDLPALKKLATEDVMSSRLIPNTKNLYYAVPELLQKQISLGVFKPLITDTQVKGLTTENMELLTETEDK